MTVFQTIMRTSIFDPYLNSPRLALGNLNDYTFGNTSVLAKPTAQLMTSFRSWMVSERLAIGCLEIPPTRRFSDPTNFIAFIQRFK